ncbi:MAG TPA: serine protease [Bacteroidetes bacterium]|nr:serine protease [Bacteroidota bacterium]
MHRYFGRILLGKQMEPVGGGRAFNHSIVLRNFYMKQFIDKYKNTIIQIATPYSTGTGFYLKKAGLIVTNEHVVGGNKEVVVEGVLIARQLATVVYTDPRYDLAFLRCEVEPVVPSLALSNGEGVAEGDRVTAIGHPFGLKFTATQGIISNTRHRENDIQYYQHDAALNPGNSGGPLVNEKGEVVGVNTFIIQHSDNLGFSLPVFYLDRAIRQFAEEGKGRIGGRCQNCLHLVFEDTVEGEFCPHCGTKIKLPHQEEEYEAAGIPLTIEQILEKTGHDIKLARRGPHLWEVLHGSAKIYITYYEPNGVIAGDAILCDLPQNNIKEVYEFLLRQNDQLEGLAFSVKGQEIVLSLIIFDRYLNLKSGMKMFRRLFQKADDYDNILVERFGCRWKEGSKIGKGSR